MRRPGLFPVRLGPPCLGLERFPSGDEPPGLVRVPGPVLRGDGAGQDLDFLQLPTARTPAYVVPPLVLYVLPCDMQRKRNS